MKLSFLVGNCSLVFFCFYDVCEFLGISGCFPESANVKEFQDNLYNKVNMMTDEPTRWAHNNPDVPKRAGKLRNYEEFDPSIFGEFFFFYCISGFGIIDCNKIK